MNAGTDSGGQGVQYWGRVRGQREQWDQGQRLGWAQTV